MASGPRYRGLVAAAAAWLLAIAALRAETLTVATYNVENYTSADRMAEVGYRKDYPKPETEKAALRAVIRGLGADLLVLQEMGPQPYLDELQRDLKAAGLDYPYAMLVDGPDADRHVALLSRRALKNVKPHPALEITYFGAKEKVKRGLLEVSVATTAGDVTIFGLHLKSRYTDRADDPLSALRRVEEAGAIRDAILKEFPEPGSAGAKFLVLGDFNDSKTSKPVQRLRERGKTVVAELLPAADGRCETWTHHYHKDDSYSRVDHILVSAALKPGVRGGRAVIYDGPGTNEASDHRPVVVTLELGQ
ncbi:MAG: endonuclease/exonuclease/phosphatase family protein [Verrucomicrobia bacterium]|nr:endonuclease/exonuclease/phosphatase family protein [Verrucomicrobiota bacterium]